MSEDEILYTAEPNRVLGSGAETLDVIGLSFVVRSTGVTLETRTGAVSERTISIDYSDVLSVELVEEVAYGLCIETPLTEYTVTNVTASKREAERVLAAIRERTTGLGTTPTRGGRSADQSPPPDGAPGTTSAADGGRTQPTPDGHRGASPTTDPDVASGTRPGEAETDASEADAESGTLGFGTGPETGRPGETIECPVCDHETLVPDEIPPEEQDVVCPGCENIIGHTHEDGDCVYIDADIADGA